jgi:hypothetical protein
MNELKPVSKQSEPIVENAITAAFRDVEVGIQKTELRLQEFELRHQMSTAEFIRRYENDEFQETLEFGEWVGEYRMLQGLKEDANQLSGIEC